MLKKGAKLKAHLKPSTQHSADLRMLRKDNYIERTQNSNIHHKQSNHIPNTKINDDNEEEKE